MSVTAVFQMLESAGAPGGGGHMTHIGRQRLCQSLLHSKSSRALASIGKTIFNSHTKGSEFKSFLRDTCLATAVIFLLSSCLEFKAQQLLKIRLTTNKCQIRFLEGAQSILNDFKTPSCRQIDIKTKNNRCCNKTLPSYTLLLYLSAFLRSIGDLPCKIT